MTCDSHKTETACTGMVDGTNKCAWQGGVCVRTSEKLGDGMVGITSVPEEGMGMPSGGMDMSDGGMSMQPAPTNDSFCSMPPDTTSETGISCMAYMEMYTYNQTTNTCEMYGYGGCDGTENLFASQAACESAAAEFCGLEKTESASQTSANVPVNQMSPSMSPPATMTTDTPSASSSLSTQPQLVSLIVLACSCLLATMF